MRQPPSSSIYIRYGDRSLRMMAIHFSLLIRRRFRPVVRLVGDRKQRNEENEKNQAGDAFDPSRKFIRHRYIKLLERVRGGVPNDSEAFIFIAR